MVIIDNTTRHSIGKRPNSFDGTKAAATDGLMRESGEVLQRHLMNRTTDDNLQRDLSEGLKNRDFSRLESLFIGPGTPRVIESHRN
jgi:hypothetical protein